MINFVANLILNLQVKPINHLNLIFISQISQIFATSNIFQSILCTRLVQLHFPTMQKLIVGIFLSLCIKNSISISEVYCIFKLIQWEGELMEKCEVSFMEFTPVIDGELIVENVNGSHFDGFTDNHVKTLIIKNFKLEKIPQGFTNFFKNLEELQISNADLKSIKSEDLIEYKNLTTLSLRGNLLTILPSGLFGNTKNLEFIDFSFNRLKYIDTDIFDDVPNLRQAFFMNNICTGRDQVYAYDRDEVQYVVEKYLHDHCRVKENCGN